jgi:hypothetical protein
MLGVTEPPQSPVGACAGCAQIILNLGIYAAFSFFANTTSLKLMR